MNIFIELKKDLIDKKILNINKLTNELNILFENSQNFAKQNKPQINEGSFNNQSPVWNSLQDWTNHLYITTIHAEELKFQRSEEAMFLLSLAKQTISRIHDGGFPPHSLKTQVYPNIMNYQLIRNGRNQGMHCDEPNKYLPPVKTLFKELKLVSNGSIDLDLNPTKNYCYEVIKHLKWDDTDSIVKSLENLTSHISFDSWKIIFAFVAKTNYPYNFFSEENLFYSLPKVYQTTNSISEELINDFLIFLKTDSFYKDFEVFEQKKLIPIEKINELSKVLEKFSNQKNILKTQKVNLSKSFSKKDFE